MAALTDGEELTAVFEVSICLMILVAPAKTSKFVRGTANVIKMHTRVCAPLAGLRRIAMTPLSCLHAPLHQTEKPVPGMEYVVTTQLVVVNVDTLVSPVNLTLKKEHHAQVV